MLTDNERRIADLMSRRIALYASEVETVGKTVLRLDAELDAARAEGERLRDQLRYSLPGSNSEAVRHMINTRDCDPLTGRGLIALDNMANSVANAFSKGEPK